MLLTKLRALSPPDPSLAYGQYGQYGPYGPYNSLGRNPHPVSVMVGDIVTLKCEEVPGPIGRVISIDDRLETAIVELAGSYKFPAAEDKIRTEYELYELEVFMVPYGHTGPYPSQEDEIIKDGKENESGESEKIEILPNWKVNDTFGLASDPGIRKNITDVNGRVTRTIIKRKRIGIVTGILPVGTSEDGNEGNGFIMATREETGRAFYEGRRHIDDIAHEITS